MSIACQSDKARYHCFKLAPCPVRQQNHSHDVCHRKSKKTFEQVKLELHATQRMLVESAAIDAKVKLSQNLKRWKSVTSGNARCAIFPKIKMRPPPKASSQVSACLHDLKASGGKSKHIVAS
jgi:hypothetical protein